jgi:hypothetical protein
MERDHLEELILDWRIILKWIKMWDREVWTGLLWLRIGIGGELVNAAINLRIP